MRKEAKEKLVEKGIKWKEEYTEKTEFLKEQFEDTVGPGSYFRFEGTAPNGDGYYCIVGPAKVHAPRAKFFAGVRKLPATYSAGGKYFDSLDSAARYARETWGVKTPGDLRPYTSRQLVGISKKVATWKKKREEDENKDKETEGSSRIIDIESFNIDVILREAMPTAKLDRTDYIWNTYEAITTPGAVENFETLKKENPSFIGALNEIKEEKRKRYAIYTRKYNFTPEKMREIFRTYVGYSENHGLYAIYVGPYLMAPIDFNRLYVGLDSAGILPPELKTNGQPNFGQDIPTSVLKIALNGVKEDGTPLGIPTKSHRELKRLAGLYYADMSGKFQAFQKPYHVPTPFKEKQELLKGVEGLGLSRFDGQGEISSAEHAEYIAEHGATKLQEVGLDDYSYIFNHRARYNIGLKENKKASQFFKRKQFPPQKPDGSTFNYGPTLPANYQGDPECHIYSFSNYDEAVTNNMIISRTGTRMFMNRNGTNKILMNVMAMHPQYNERLLEYLRSPKSAKRYIHPEIKPYVLKDLGSLLHYLTGVGHMDQEGIDAIAKWFKKGEHEKDRQWSEGNEPIVNGTLNLDDWRVRTSKAQTPPPIETCGVDKHIKLTGEILKFYNLAILEDQAVTALTSFDFIEEAEARALYEAGLKTINDIKSLINDDPKFESLSNIENISIDSAQKIELGIGALEEDWELPEAASDAIRRGEDDLADIWGLFKLCRSTGSTNNPITGKKTSGAFLTPSIADRNSGMSVTSKAKNEMRLVCEIGSYMAMNNIDIINEENAELISEYLNNGGDVNPPWYQRKKDAGAKMTLESRLNSRRNHLVKDDFGNKTRKIFFSASNVKPLMAKVLSKKVLSDVMGFVQENDLAVVVPESVEMVVGFLEHLGNRNYYNNSNTRGVLRDAIYRLGPGKDDEVIYDDATAQFKLRGAGIQEISREKVKQSLIVEEIYDNERQNDKKVEALELKGDEAGAEELFEGNLNLIWVPEVKNDDGEVIEEGKFESYDTHSSFDEAFYQIRDIVDTMAYGYIERGERLIDPVSQLPLISVDEAGNPEAHRIPPIFMHAPDQIMRSAKLKAIFAALPEEQKALYRTKRSDLAFAQLLLGPLSDDELDTLSRQEYKHQLEQTKEVNKDINMQVPNDGEMEEGFDYDGAGAEDQDGVQEENIEGVPVGDDDADNQRVIDPEVEDVENPDAKREQEAQPEAEDAFAVPEGLDVGGFGGFDLPDDPNKPKKGASVEVIGNLIKLSAELDNEGKTKESIELLRLAKKFSGDSK